MNKTIKIVNGIEILKPDKELQEKGVEAEIRPQKGHSYRFGSIESATDFIKTMYPENEDPGTRTKDIQHWRAAVSEVNDVPLQQVKYIIQGEHRPSVLSAAEKRTGGEL